MNKKQTGRPVDLNGINVHEIDNWMKENVLVRKILICQSIIALSNGAKMSEVCNVLGVTREGVRLWKNQLRRQGLKGMLKKKKAGKRSKLNPEKEKELKKMLKKSPQDYGYNNKKWSGALIQDYVNKLWGFEISLRTAQLWLSKIR